MIDAPLHAKYRDLSSAADRALRSAAHHPDPVPTDGDPRWGLSLVLRIEGEVRDALCAELAALAAARRAPHLVYAPEHLHSTVRSLEGFRDEVPPGLVDRYAALVREAVAGLPEIEIDFRGLGASEGGVFACGYAGPGLTELRERLRRARPASDRPGGDGDRVRDTAHVSLMVFRPPLVPEPGLADHVAARRDTAYGTVRVRSLSLVRYRPTADSAGLTELDRITL
ncbi:2'-5' RNA ligase family protein [Kitasatospora sp. NPDC096147]|uniref:2'-5' RNA ligase family protein n=1 Tax=Kitasatospora sp. NPDC096147 TaxID=3364093 RepID=UPI00382DAF40